MHADCFDSLKVKGKTKMRLSWIAASTFLGLALLAPAAQAQQKIGVVRVTEVVRGMAESKKAVQSGTARETEAEQHQANLEREIQTLQGQLSQIKENSAQYRDLRSQLDEKQISAEGWVKKTKLDLSRAAKDDVHKMFDHVSDAIQQIATEQHFNLVVSDNTPEILGPNFDQMTVQQYGAMLSQRNVLFADKTVDITQDVLTRVDAIYAKQNQGTAVPAPTPVIPGKK
jgi:Skp family chaperone for outer membrane proteins